VAESLMPTAHGEFRMIAYESEVEGGESHVALVYGDVTGDDPVPVRVHTHCLSGDVFSTTLCDCRAVVESSLRMIAEAGRGALVYLHNGAAGFGVDHGTTPGRVVFHREHRSKEGSEDRAHRTLRQVGLGGQILSDLGIHKIRLLTNTPTHVPALQGFGIEIVEQVPVSVAAVRR
jgi:3,4-dihydroxy 2-butanone 4-phosphate synthase/GTP cyclohydrolase II